MLDQIEFYVCLLVTVITILAGFVPKLIQAYSKCRKKSAIKKSKQNFRNINDYDDYDEDLYVLDLEKEEQTYRAKKHQNPDAYDENGRPKINFLMNAISLVIGFQSTISLIGLPVEFYYHGFKSLQITLAFIVAPIIMAIFFVPIIYKIKSSSIYEYLDDKFNDSKSVKYFTVILMIIFQLVFASIVLFSTSNTIMQIISLDHNIDLWPIVAALGIISLSLALLGLKSVIWANFIQYVIMIICNAFVIYIGAKNFAGNQSGSLSEGVSLISNITISTGHSQFFNLKENFQYRYTLWNGLIGMSFNVIPTYCLTQQSFMRIKQAKSLRSARWLVLTIIPFGFLNLFLIILLGAVIFAYFYKCGDPVSNGLMKNQNQLLSRFLTQFYTDYTGLIGFYIALLISSSINSIASSLKGLSVTISEDVIGPLLSRNKQSSESLGRTSYKMRRMSEKYGFSQEEEILNFQIRFNTSRNKRKLLKEFKKKQQRPHKRTSTLSVIFTSILIIFLAIWLEKSSDSVTSSALSILNSIHGPLLFIYICARFNEYSTERNNYAHNRSTISKLNNLYIHYVDVILSSLCAIGLLQFLYFGKLYTFSDYKEFYNAENLQVNNYYSKVNVTSSLQNFCNLNESKLRDTFEVSSLLLKHNLTSYNNNVMPPDISLIQFFGISFSWYPFIGFIVCCLVLSWLSMLRFCVRKALRFCFKCR